MRRVYPKSGQAWRGGFRSPRQQANCSSRMVARLSGTASYLRAYLICDERTSTLKDAHQCCGTANILSSVACEGWKLVIGSRPMQFST
jgi:hypothetical protein